jgi:hypothetical protein
MTQYKFVLAAMAACLATSVWAAADATSATTAPTVASTAALSVAQIVERNVQARGGLSAWKRIQTMSMSGQLDAGKQRSDGGRVAMLDRAQAKAQAKAEVRTAVFGKGDKESAKVIQLPFRMDLERPLKSRLEIPFQGDTAVQVYDGTTGWKLRPFLGRHQVEPYSADELKAASEQQALDGPLADYAAKGTQVTLDGTKLVDGRHAYKLKLTLKNGDVRHLWIDAQSFLDVKIDGTPRRLDGKLHTVFTYFRDYKAVDGLMIAHQLETTVDGMPGAQRILIEKVALNPPLETSRFNKPM